MSVSERPGSAGLVVLGIGTEQQLPARIDHEQQHGQQRDATRGEGHRRPQ